MTDSARLMPGAKPFFRRSGPVGCLVVHGFASSPGEVRWLAQHLAEAGFTTLAPRLPGHGSHPHDLRRVRRHDWLAALLDAYAILRGECERVVVAGHSMGGLLALRLSLEVETAGVAVMASPVQFGPKSIRYARWLRYVLRDTDQRDRSGLDDIVREEQARRGEPVIGRMRYDRWATAAVAELYALSQEVDALLPQIRVPLLLVYSEGDHTAPPANGERIYSRAASGDKGLIALQHSGHNLPVDVEREAVFGLVTEFALRL
ncbi:MAG: alpha/beta fold hydrolase [Anaerolineae bacterium]|nr:alpha/beta fold hydrolase [Anaerolineae bacterium]